MTYRWLDDLDLALAAHGVPFVEVNEHGADYTASTSWRVRGRPASTGGFDPQGVLCHHTASPAGTSDEADINCLMWGNTQAPGPVSQLYIGRTGVVYVLAAGRCNHGGGGKRPGVDFACTDMNGALLGIEAGNSGVGERWPAAQTVIYAQTVAALCLWYRWPRTAIYLHATTGPPSGGCNSKIDPAGPWEREPDLVGSTTWNLDVWRAYCVEQAYNEPLPPEDDMAFACPLFVEATGADGNVRGAVFATDGRFQTIKWLNPYAFDDAKYWARAAGYPEEAMTPTPVDRVGSYGVLVNESDYQEANR